jgi:hypothetical protein
MLSLEARIEKVVATQHLPLDRMELELYYAIAHADRLTTLQEATVQLLMEDRDKQYFIDLPQRYARVVRDDGIKMFNWARVWWTIAYKGFCNRRQLPLLDIM